jgi:hypothetical protein
VSLLADGGLSRAAAKGSAGVRVYAKVDAETTIYPGDDFVYSIVIEGGAKPTKVDLSPILQFNPRRAPSGTSMQTVNDRTTISYSENYIITASKAGKMSLPSVTVEAGGETYTTNLVEVTVSQPGTTDRMQVELSLSEKQCYVGQPLVMTVRWIISVRWEGAAFDVPVFKSSDDFYIEDVSDPAAAQAAQQIAIHNVPVTIAADRQLIKGMEAQVISFRKVLIPKRAGHVRFDPVTVSTNMAVGTSRTGDFFNSIQTQYKRVSVQSDAVELEVLPLPEAGKPPQFYGLVGRYTISASASPTQVNVGDPITLTIRIGGSPYLKPVQWPELTQVPELADNFKIPTERASPTVEKGEKVFTQTIRANNDRVAQVPAIPLVYFDPQKGEYVTARTDPIKLEVAPTKVLTNADVEGTASAPVNREVEAIRKGISANYYGSEVLTNQSFSLLSAILHPGYGALWSIPLVGLILSSVARFVGRSSPQSLARKRRRQAAAVAVRQLKKIAKQSKTGSLYMAQDGRRPSPISKASGKHGNSHASPAFDSVPEQLASAMKGYIADRFDRVAGSLTADDCHQIIAESAGDTRTAAKYRELITDCEQARYAPLDAHVEADQDAKPKEMIHHLIDLVTGSKQTRHTPPSTHIGLDQVAKAMEMIRLIEKQAGK